MEQDRALSDLFQYDFWANRLWSGSLGGFQSIERAQQVLEHILSSQRTWLNRCGVEVIEPTENVALEELFEQYSAAWRMQVTERPLEERIEYATSTGQSYVNTIGDIARHVINHGTYHRGQLRGLAEADGFTGFPETDYIVYAREVRGSA
jgi:uncharacterized damage-inducible protein DinB